MADWRLPHSPRDELLFHSQRRFDPDRLNFHVLGFGLITSSTLPL